MKRFHVKARDRSGTLVEETVSAESKVMLLEKLGERGVFVVEIKELKMGLFSKKTVPIKLLIHFFGQLSHIVESGVNLHRGIQMIYEQVDHVYFKIVLESVLADIENGSSLSKAFERFPNVFSRSLVFQIRSAEDGGFIERSLRRISETLEGRYRLQRQIRGALIYPIMVLVGTVGLVYFLMNYIVPSMATTLSDFGSELPMITVVLMKISDWVQEFGLYAIGGAFASVFGFRQLLKNEKIRYMYDKNLLKIPLFGEVIKMSLIIEFNMTLTSLLIGGVQLSKALDNLVESTKNVYFREVLANLTSRLVNEGLSFTKTLEDNGFFGKHYIQMVSVGEESGNLPDMLESLTAYMNEDLSIKIKTTIELLNPILMVFLTVIVGVVVFALFTPMFSLMDSM